MQQVIRPINGPIQKSIKLPGSKSITHRAIMLAALADGVSELSGVRISNDTRTFINALSQLGIIAQLDETSSSCIIGGGSGLFPKKQANIWCDEFSIVARFLLVACAATPGVFLFDGSTELRKAALIELLHILCRHGAQFIPNDSTHIPLTLVGADTLAGGDIIVENAQNSQMISALLMISPYTRSPLIFTIEGETTHPFIEMTCAMMAEFGVRAHRIHHGKFMVPVPQRYTATDYTIEPDLSLASYFFAAAAITGGEITLTNYKRAQSKQKHITFISLLEKMGCTSRETTSDFTIKGPKKLHGVNVTLSEIKNNITALVISALFAESPTIITYGKDLSQYNFQRLQLLVTELTKLGAQLEMGTNTLTITPGILHGGTVESHDDHHIAMAFSILGLIVPGITIQHYECVTKISAEFYTLINELSERTHAKA